MALGDYEFLLHKLRIVTYGESYKVTTRCPECGEIVETVANLGDLELKDFDEEKFNNLKHFTLPVSGKLVALNVLTPHLLEEIESRVKDMQRKYKGAAIDFETLIKLQVCIDSVDGTKYSPNELDGLINNLPAKDMAKILNNIDELNQCIGLDNRLFLTCPKCKADFVNFFRFGPEFFRPTTL